MASPQLEDGYTKIANELLEELCRFPMGGPHFRIAIWVLRFTYGWNGRKTMRLNMAEIGRGVRMDRGNVRRTIRDLGRMNVVNLDGKDIGINKDWESWRLQNEVNVTTKSDSNGVKLTPKMKSNGPQECSQTDPLYKERKKLKDITPNTPLKSKPKKATPAPSKFPITEDHIFWVVKTLGKVPTETIEFQRDQFLDFFKGSGTPKKDWEATWRNWMRNWWKKYGGEQDVSPETDNAAIWEEIQNEQ